MEETNYVRIVMAVALDARHAMAQVSISAVFVAVLVHVKFVMVVVIAILAMAQDIKNAYIVVETKVVMYVTDVE